MRKLMLSFAILLMLPLVAEARNNKKQQVVVKNNVVVRNNFITTPTFGVSTNAVFFTPAIVPATPSPFFFNNTFGATTTFGCNSNVTQFRTFVFP